MLFYLVETKYGYYVEYPTDEDGSYIESDEVVSSDVSKARKFLSKTVAKELADDINGQVLEFNWNDEYGFIDSVKEV